MTKDLVSIIIPVKNRSGLFKKAFHSVINQKYQHLEIIVVDDGSDPSEYKQIINTIQETQHPDYTRIKNIWNTKSGATSARNLGLKESEGEFIQFFDSDDILLPQKIETEINFLKNNPELDFVYSKARYIDENENLLDEYWGIPLSGNSSDYFNFSYQTMCPLYRRSAIEKFGNWDESLLINQDWEFSIRYLLLGAKCHFIDAVHSYFRVHNKDNIGKTDRKPNIIYSKFIGHKKIFDLIEKLEKKDRLLEKLFIKRFIYIFLVTKITGSGKIISEQKKYLVEKFPLKTRFLLMAINNKWIAKSILKLYKLFFPNQIPQK